MATLSEFFVSIPQGKLKGKQVKSIFGIEFLCFHKIPYAKAPLGDLRFKAPVPADGWTGVRDATQEGPVFPSVDRVKGTFLKDSKEDCLFLNVYCKQLANNPGAKKSPVMICFHPGGFEFGTGNKSYSGPDFLMGHDIVLVTFNYRLGAFGFLSLQTVECPGNYGLKDQQLVLKWVKHNISHFGGDPDNVTIFGVSAGAISVHYQILCLKNKGLFRRAIMQSGSALSRWGCARKPRENAFALGKRLGCHTTDDKVLLDFLKKASVEDIVVKAQGLINETEGESLGERFFNFTFVPTVEPEHEGAVITEHPWVLVKQGKYLDVYLITGVTTHEMILGLMNSSECPKLTSTEDFEKLIPREIQVPRSSEQSLAIATKIKEFYFENGVNIHNYLDILSDTFINYGIFRIIKCITTNHSVKTPTYLYLFSYEGEQAFLKNLLGLGGIKGVCHGDDSMYLLCTDFLNADKMVPGTRDYNFMMKYTKLWTSFATTGIPRIDEPGVKWKVTHLRELDHLNIGERFVMEKGLFRERMEFWDAIFTAYYDKNE